MLAREELSLRLAGEAAKPRASEPPLVQARELRDGQHEDVVLCYQLRCHKWRENASASTNPVPSRRDWETASEVQ